MGLKDLGDWRVNELVHDSMSMSVSIGLYVNDVLCLCWEWEQCKREKGKSCLMGRWDSVSLRYDSLCYQRPLLNTLNRKVFGSLVN